MKKIILLLSIQLFVVNSMASEPKGFRLTDFKEKSVLAHVGFKKGDLIKSINDSTDWYNDPQEIGELFKKPGVYDVQIEREGKPQTIHFTVK